ncbi:hypothetical protein ACEQ8H_004520 [Pleosporales sp. CAS-2024a]
MRSTVLLFLTTLLALVAAIPITPSAPRLQKRAEEFRLQGLREFEIAERLSASAAEPESLASRIQHKLDHLLHADDLDLFAGDIAPGSMESPSMLPTASSTAGERESFFRCLRALFHIHHWSDDFGYEGKEGEMRRPTGMRHW